MGVIGWIVLGGLAGWVANMIMNEDGGLLKNIVVGILGAVLGGFIFNSLGGDGVDDFSISSFLVALVGSIILITIVRMFRGKK